MQVSNTTEVARRLVEGCSIHRLPLPECRGLDKYYLSKASLLSCAGIGYHFHIKWGEDICEKVGRKVEDSNKGEG